MLNCDRNRTIDIILVVSESGDTLATVNQIKWKNWPYFFDAAINYIKDLLKNIT